MVNLRRIFKRKGYFMSKLISASLAIALTSVSIGWAGNLESEAMEEETIMVAEETMATDFLGSNTCLLYTSPSPRDRTRSRMPSSA